MSNFGSRLKNFRESIKESRTIFGKRFDVSDDAVGTWENDKAKPSFDVIYFLAGKGVDLNELFTGKKKDEEETTDCKELHRQIHERDGMIKLLQQQLRDAQTEKAPKERRPAPEHREQGKQ